MWVALTGSHSTGKTTLVDQLALAFADQNPVIIKEIARQVIASGLPLGKGARLPGFASYIALQLGAERSALMGGKNLVISDRTLLDAIAYATVNQRWYGQAEVPDYVIAMLQEVWMHERQAYQVYLYCPIEFPAVDDGVRDMDDIYRDDIDNEIQRLLLEHEVDHFRVTGSMIERPGSVIAYINELEL